jgi:uridine phosphorylase
MESAALFTVAAYLGVRVGSLFFVVGNQEREKAGLSNPIVHDTSEVIEISVEGIRNLILRDRS